MKKLFLTYSFLFFAFCSIAQQNFDVNELLKPGARGNSLVHDYTATLSAGEKQQLETKLHRFDDSTSNQIAVVLIPSLQGNDVADFTTELGRAWGVGGKQFNNGVVLLVAKNDRKMHIATGYGLEGAIPDVLASQVIQEILKPNFRGGNYYEGIDEGTNALMLAAQGKYRVAREYGGSGVSFGTLLLIGFLIFIFLIIISKNSGGGGGSFMSRRGYRGYDPPIFFPPSSGGSWIGGGNWGGGGSSGGGGFGGFGGGSFGGGGASGDW